MVTLPYLVGWSAASGLAVGSPWMAAQRCSELCGDCCDVAIRRSDQAKRWFFGSLKEHRLAPSVDVYLPANLERTDE